MNFTLSREQEQLRMKLRTFLSNALEDSSRDTRIGFSPEFSQAVAQNGWIGLGWPVAIGGGGAGAIEQLICTEEMSAAEAPWDFHHLAESQVGPTIIKHGTKWQQDRFLPLITAGKLSFCLGMSEPGAGSDLAAASTRAVREGDTYRVNGQKIWTSFAHRADMCWLVARTDPAAPKHRGISLLIVDMQTPGITVRPLANIRGKHEFNEVFFDDVMVPSECRVGSENAGWYLLAEHLDFERSGIERIVKAKRLLHQLIDSDRTAAKSPLMRMELSELLVELEVGRLLAYRVAWLQSTGKSPTHEAAMSKLFGSEWVQRVAATAMRHSGMGAAANHADGFLARVTDWYLSAVSMSITGGTSEIQKNIIAGRGLGLPR